MADNTATMLVAWEHALQACHNAATEAASILVVGIQTSIGRDLHRRAAAEFATRQPGWRLLPRLCPWEDPTAGLADHGTDGALLWLPVPDSPRPSTAVLFTEPRWVVFADNHPLALHELVPFDALLDEPFIALPKSAGSLRDYWLSLVNRPPDHPCALPPRRVPTRASN